MKLYISGPVTGYEQGNKPAFDQAKETLKAAGHDPISPFDGETSEQTNETLTDKYGSLYWKVLAKDIVMMAGAEGVVLLPGWERSKGARIEAYVALHAGLPIFDNISLQQIDPSYVAGVAFAEWIPKKIKELAGIAA